jgi:hypothetical protein
MDKGIRPAMLAEFAKQLPNHTPFGDPKVNCAFRKSVMATIMEQFGITVASAATHYNHALIQAQTNAPELVKGLGRAPDKKGGRKKKVAPVVVTQELVGPVQPEAQPEAVAQVEEQPAELEAPQEGGFSEAAPAVELVTVYKKKDDSVVHADMPLAEAEALVAENNAKMFVSKLYIK